MGWLEDEMTSCMLKLWHGAQQITTIIIYLTRPIKCLEQCLDTVG